MWECADMKAVFSAGVAARERGINGELWAACGGMVPSGMEVIEGGGRLADEDGGRWRWLAAALPPPLGRLLTLWLRSDCAALMMLDGRDDA